MRARGLIAAGLLAAWSLSCLGPARADTDESPLRRWFLGFEVGNSTRDTYEVFAQPGIPPGEVMEEGGGWSARFGYRFGERFLVGLQVVMVTHDLTTPDTAMRDAEVLLTGTVLFRERSSLQPFLRGGIGGTELTVMQPLVHTQSAGLAAVAGGGLQWQIIRGMSLEFEAVALFANYTKGKSRSQIDGLPDTDWTLKKSNLGARFGIGLIIWF